MEFIKEGVYRSESLYLKLKALNWGFFWESMVYFKLKFTEMDKLEEGVMKALDGELIVDRVAFQREGLL